MPDRLHPPVTKPVTSLEYLPAEQQHLPCGVELYCAPKRELGVLRIDLYWPFGTAVQDKSAQARTANQLMFGGTKTRTAEAILDEFESWGASFSCDTGLLSSSISIKSIKENLKDIIPVLIDVLENASYPQNELDLFKSVEHASLLRKMQTPGYWSQRLSLEALYGVHSADTNFTDIEDLAAIGQNELLSYKQTNLAGRFATVFISGDYDQKTLALLDNCFSQLNPSDTRASEATFSPPLNQTELIKKHLPHSNQISLCMAKHLNRVSPLEFPKLSLLNLFLGGFFGSRLMQDLREEKGLTYGIGSNISLSGNGHTWMISGEMNSDNADITRDSIREILIGLWKNPPKGDELEKAKRYYGGQLRGSLDGPFSEPGKIQFLLKTGYPQNYYQQALQTIWSTDSETLAELAYNYLNPDSFSIALAGATGEAN